MPPLLLPVTCSSDAYQSLYVYLQLPGAPHIHPELVVNPLLIFLSTTCVLGACLHYLHPFVQFPPRCPFPASDPLTSICLHCPLTWMSMETYIFFMSLWFLNMGWTSERAQEWRVERGGARTVSAIQTKTMAVLNPMQSACRMQSEL